MSEITKDENRRTKTKDRLIWLFLALVILFVYFFALRSIPLIGPDEPRYAQVAREMFDRRDFVTPTLGGFDWFEKPALLYWLQIISYKIFGISEFAARFGSALFGLGTIFSLWILGRKSAADFTDDAEKISKKLSANSARSAAKDFASWLVLIGASSIGLLAFSRAASFDIVLTFPITASLVGFFIFDQRREKDSETFHFSLFAFYFFIGVALLAKGLIGMVFPFAIVAFYYVLSRKLPNKTFVVSLFWGTILSLLIASFWYAPMYLTHGWKFIDEFFIQHQFQRYTSNKFQHPQPFWFFLIVLPLMTIPWLPFFLASIWRFIKEIFSRQLAEIENQDSKNHNSTFANLKTFAAAWLLVPLVFFSFSGSKLPGYILPALPAAIILTAETVWRFAGENRNRTRLIQLFAFTTLVCVVVALQFFAKGYARADTVKSLIETATARGFADARILNFNDISHNAEFYGAGRLIRTADGKQRRFAAAAEIVEELKRENAPALLILTPLESVAQLSGDGSLDAETLDDNGETAIVVVRNK